MAVTMQKARLIKENGNWVIPIAGGRIERCIVDYGISYEVETSDGTATLRIEGEFHLESHNEQYSLSPETPLCLGPALALLHSSIQTASAQSDGKLVLRLEDGRSLSINADEEYEAWQLKGPNKLMLVCMPGGNIAVWQ